MTHNYGWVCPIHNVALAPSVNACVVCTENTNKKLAVSIQSNHASHVIEKTVTTQQVQSISTERHATSLDNARSTIRS